MLTYEFLGLATVGDALGAAGSFLLLLPPMADQIRRLRLWAIKTKMSEAPEPFKSLGSKAVRSTEVNHSSWKPWESLTMAFGAFLLMMSFWHP